LSARSKPGRDVGSLELLSTADVARLSGFSTKTVRRAIAAGELVASLVRGEYRVWPEEFRQWIDGRRVPGEPRQRATLRQVDSDLGSIARLRALELEA